MMAGKAARLPDRTSTKFLYMKVVRLIHARFCPHEGPEVESSSSSSSSSESSEDEEASNSDSENELWCEVIGREQGGSCTFLMH